MIIIAATILFYLFVRVVVVLYNYAIQPYLLRLLPENKPLVSVLVPARNEEKNILHILKKLSAQSYGNFELLVYDDHSEDKTAELVEKYAKTDNRIKLLKGRELPVGWLGKTHACHNLAKNSKGDYMLFLDADVNPSKHLVANAIGYMQQNKTGLLSLFPHQVMQSTGEVLTVPLMYSILLTLLPLAFVRKSKRHSFSGANGQFMLFKREVYFAHMPHWWKKDEPAEDIAIMAFFKKLNIPCATLLGGDDISCRMYNGGQEAVKGFSKNVIRFFGNSLFFTLFHLLITTFGIVPMLFIPETAFLSFYLIGVLVIHAILGRISGESVLKAWLLIIPRQITLAVVVSRAIIYRFKQNYEWKGRRVKI